MTDTMTARAARWCVAAGIPPPDEIEEPGFGIVSLWWWIGSKEFLCDCNPDGDFYWNIWQHGGTHDSASLIAAIKDAMA